MPPALLGNRLDHGLYRNPLGFRLSAFGQVVDFATMEFIKHLQAAGPVPGSGGCPVLELKARARLSLV